MAYDVYKTITVSPLSPHLGAEISGVDLSKPLSNAQFDDIHQAFLKHHVVFFRDQALTPEPGSYTHLTPPNNKHM